LLEQIGAGFQKDEAYSRLSLRKAATFAEPALGDSKTRPTKESILVKHFQKSVFPNFLLANDLQPKIGENQKYFLKLDQAT
jgi:hypothetical protein